MKVLIDIPQEVLEHPHNYCCYTLANQIKGNYTPISDNATIGDVITATFPNKQIDYKYDHLCNNEFMNVGDLFRVDLDTWNAPYKEEENGSN